jgi:hypothetical protein
LAFFGRGFFGDRLAQRRLVELADARDGKGIDELDALGKLELGEALLFQERAERFDVRRRHPGAYDEIGARTLMSSTAGLQCDARARSSVPTCPL